MSGVYYTGKFPRWQSFGDKKYVVGEGLDPPSVYRSWEILFGDSNRQIHTRRYKPYSERFREGQDPPLRWRMDVGGFCIQIASVPVDTWRATARVAPTRTKNSREGKSLPAMDARYYSITSISDYIRRADHSDRSSAAQWSFIYRSGP